MMALIGCFCMRHLVRASIVRYMCRICICLAEMSTIYQLTPSTVVPANSDSDVVLCLQLLSKTLTRTCYLSWGESIDHSCINPILRIGLIHKWSIDYKSLITLWTGHEVTVALGLQDSSYFLLVAVVAVCWWPLQTVWTRTGTDDRMSDLVWFQAV